jgi:hypothetical protein
MSVPSCRCLASSEVRTDWRKLEDALRAARIHILASEPREALAALDLASDAVEPLRLAEAEQRFNTEVENWR